MKLRSFSWVMLVCGLILAAVGAVAPVLALQLSSQGAAMGIIGGADASTYRFVMFTLLDGWPFCAVLFGGSLTVSGLFCLFFGKTVERYCSVKTSAVSLALSAVGAMGFVCAILWYAMAAFHETEKHPILHPVCVALGVICLIACIVLIAWYIKFRKKQRSIPGVLVDVLTCILYFPAFFFAFSYLFEMG